MICGLRACARTARLAQRDHHPGAGDRGGRPQRVHRDRHRGELVGPSQGQQALGVLADGVPDVGADPSRVQVQRGRDVDHVRIGRPAQVRKAACTTANGPSTLISSSRRRFFGGSFAVGRRSRAPALLTTTSMPPNASATACDRPMRPRRVADIAGQRQRLATRGSHGVRGLGQSARDLRIRRLGLGQQRHARRRPRRPARRWRAPMPRLAPVTTTTRSFRVRGWALPTFVGPSVRR